MMAQKQQMYVQHAVRHSCRLVSSTCSADVLMEFIHAGRQRRGLQPLQLVVVGLVASGTGAGGGKLSSTELRQAEAAAGSG